MSDTIENASRILAGCPNGATEAALATNGISRATLDRMVELGLAEMTNDKLRHGQIVPRFHAPGTKPEWAY